MRLIYRLLAALILVGGSAAAWFLPTVGAARFDADRTSGSSIQRRQAIAFHERRLEEDPQSALEMAQLAGLLLEEGRMRANDDALAQAEVLARRSLGQRSRRNARSAALLVNVLVARHRFPEAVKVARDLVTFDPETPAYRALLAEVLMEIGEYREAITLLGSVRPHREDILIAPRFARWAELTGQPGEARRILTMARDAAHQRADFGGEQRAWYDFLLADVELRHGHLRHAASAIRSGLNESPGDWRLILARARLEAAQGSWRKAIESAETIVADVPAPDVLALLATAHTMLGHKDEANAYVMALDAVSQRQDRAIHREWALTLLDTDSVARTVLQRAAADTLVRRDTRTLDLLAWALLRSGRADQALRISRRASAMGNVEPALRYRAGMIELAGGDSSLARVHLEMALQGEGALNAVQRADARQAVETLSRRLVP